MKTYQKKNIKSEKKNLEHVSQKVIISIKYFYKWRRETRAPSTTNENVRKDKGKELTRKSTKYGRQFLNCLNALALEI